jgi:DNA replication and repair protein RecF
MTSPLQHMYLKHLSLTNFRNFTRLDIDIPRRVVVLVGRNAQGKTSVLEAIYFLAAFTSFQTHADRQIINFDEAKNNSLTVTRLVADYQRGKSKHRIEAFDLDDSVNISGTQEVLMV